MDSDWKVPTCDTWATDNRDLGLAFEFSTDGSMIARTAQVQSQDDRLIVEPHLYVVIWGANQDIEPQFLAVPDMKADANFIDINLLNSLGFVVSNLSRFSGRRYSPACGGDVYPIARLTLRWYHWDYLGPSPEYEDQFLVLNKGLIDGVVFGQDIIRERKIYELVPGFEELAADKTDPGKFLVI